MVGYICVGCAALYLYLAVRYWPPMLKQVG